MCEDNTLKLKTLTHTAHISTIIESEKKTVRQTWFKHTRAICVHSKNESCTNEREKEKREGTKLSFVMPVDC